MTTVTRKSCRISTQNDENDLTFADPFAYIKIESTTKETNQRLKEVDYFYEYRYCSKGFVAIKYEFTRKGSVIMAKVVKAITNSDMKMVHVNDRLTFPCRYSSMYNFVNSLKEKDIIFVFNLNVRDQTVVDLLKLRAISYVDPSTLTFDSEKAKRAILQATQGRVLPKTDVTYDNFAEVVENIIDQTICVRSFNKVNSAERFLIVKAFEIRLNIHNRVYDDNRKYDNMIKKLGPATLEQYFKQLAKKLAITK